LHPYTQALMPDIPIPDSILEGSESSWKGDVPSPLNPPKGCRFHPRCPIAMEICSQKEPEFREVAPDHWVACWAVE
jgi:oligopeptide/dipeptide ABC transporter ATP-binding protein